MPVECLTGKRSQDSVAVMNGILGIRIGKARVKEVRAVCGAVGFVATMGGCLQTVTPDLRDAGRDVVDVVEMVVLDARSDAPQDESLVPPRGCNAVQWNQRTEVALNFQSSRVRGTVQYNGARLPADSSGVPNGRGRLLFLDRRQGTSAPIDLGVDDAPTLDFPLQNGDYEILYKPTINLISTPSPDMPITGGTVHPLFVLRDDRSIIVDIRSARLSTRVTVNGAPFPVWPPRLPGGPVYAYIALRNSEGELFPVATFRPTLPPVLEAPVVPGTYTVEYVGNDCSPTHPAAIPCGSFSLEQRVTIAGDQRLDVDIPYGYAAVQGPVTVNGQSLRRANPGTLTFTRPQAVAPSYTLPLSTMGSGLYYSSRMLIGHYRVDWVPAPELCSNGSVGLPCIAGTVADNFTVGNDGTIPIDLRILHIRGAVTQRGAPLAPNSARYGSIRVLNALGATRTIPLSMQNGQVGFDFPVLSGRYQVNYRPTEMASCSAGEPVVNVVCGEFVAQRMDAIVSDTTTNIDLRPVPLQLNISGSATPLPSDRTVLFAQSDPSAERFAAVRRLSVQPQFVQEARYSLSYDPDEAACARAMPRYPCIAVTLKENVPIRAGESVPVTIDSVSIHATALQNGRPFLDQPREGRGLVTIRSGAGNLPFELPIVGPPVLDTQIVPGQYFAIHQAVEGVCIVGFPSGYLCGRSVGAFCGN